MDQLNDLLKKIDEARIRGDKELWEKIEPLLRERRLNSYVSTLEQQIQLLSATFDRASTYTNLIIFAGYVGIFTLLGATREYIEKSQVMVIAMLTTASLLVFIGHEITNMVLRQNNYLRLERIIKSQRGTNPDPQVFNMGMNEHSLKLLRFWHWFFYPALALGYGAGLYLLYIYIRHVAGI